MPAVTPLPNRGLDGLQQVALAPLDPTHSTVIEKKSNE
jgi:hypothetical protein